MHELALASAVHETVIRHADKRKVQSVEMRIGRLRQVVPDSLSFYWEIVSRDTLADGAKLELELIDGLLRCGECAHEWDPAPKPAEDEVDVLFAPQFRCPQCEAGGAEILKGEEFEVESIIVDTEEEEAECTAPR
ncbi:MAG: hydrogenase maturation nickel metallochaperone HypA [Actinomycetota bacterium]|nr:hydrogenase maturation nickel metallochaperone HypA [Actinomycetota bacterium]